MSDLWAISWSLDENLLDSAWPYVLFALLERNSTPERRTARTKTCNPTSFTDADQTSTLPHLIGFLPLSNVVGVAMGHTLIQQVN